MFDLVWYLSFEWFFLVIITIKTLLWQNLHLRDIFQMFINNLSLSLAHRLKSVDINCQFSFKLIRHTRPGCLADSDPVTPAPSLTLIMNKWQLWILPLTFSCIAKGSARIYWKWICLRVLNPWHSLCHWPVSRATKQQVRSKITMLLKRAPGWLLSQNFQV